MLSIFRPFHLALILAAASGSTSGVKGAALFATGVAESVSDLPSVVGDGGLTKTFQDTSGGTVSSWAASDPNSAASYMVSLPSNAYRQVVGPVLFSISLGSYESNPEALRWAIETAIAQGSDGTGGNDGYVGVIEGDRYAGRGRDSDILATDRENAFNWIRSGQQSNYSILVPETSSMLLAAVGALVLLRRRRDL